MVLFNQLKKSGIDWKKIDRIFVTHKHVDHILGILWMMRMICQYVHQGEHPGNVEIYANSEVISALSQMANLVLQEREIKQIGTNLRLVPLDDGDEKSILNHRFSFFDLGAEKDYQFGFVMYSGKNKFLACCGDRPLLDEKKEYARECDWLLHEAFCLKSEAGIFKPYEKHHVTVSDAADIAHELRVKNLVLYHTEDKNIANRKQLYTEECRNSFSGNIFVPDDLDVIELN